MMPMAQTVLNAIVLNVSNAQVAITLQTTTKNVQFALPATTAPMAKPQPNAPKATNAQ